MGDGWNKITRRVKRIFGAKEEVQPKKLGASQVIRPEETVPRFGKAAPPSTTRRARRPQQPKPGYTVVHTPWGIVHVCFHPDGPPEAGDNVAVRDPVTRRLSRKKLTDGMRRTTGFYNKDGSLIDEREDKW
jgi:hypothetical protein